MTDGMTEAADQLRQLLAAESESVRLGAARALLELGVRLRESVDLEARIAALEGVEQVSPGGCGRRIG
jgi:HEAT repeat protein